MIAATCLAPYSQTVCCMSSSLISVGWMGNHARSGCNKWLQQMDTAALEKKVAAMTGGDALGRARKGLRGGPGSKADAAKAGASVGPDDSIRCRRSIICEGENECPSREHSPGGPACMAMVCFLARTCGH